MKPYASLLVIGWALFFALDCQAQIQNRFGGQRRPAGNDVQQRAGNFFAQLDPEQLANRMMKEFDTDGDKKLDATELTSLFKMIGERRAGQMQQAARRRTNTQGAEKNKPGSENKNRQARRFNKAADSTPGGDQPIRPATE